MSMRLTAIATKAMSTMGIMSIMKATSTITTTKRVA